MSEKEHGEQPQMHGAAERESPQQRARALARQQGVKPISKIAELRGDFWPEDESTDDFLEWLRASRKEEASRRLAE